jgi:flagella basal body P-ring formation protein FlgA
MPIAYSYTTDKHVKITARSRWVDIMRNNLLKNRHLLSLLLASGLLPTQAISMVADEIQSHDSIRKAAHQHILAQSRQQQPPIVEVGHLDSRLQLKACSEPLETFSPAGGRRLGKATVGVRCSGDNPWSLYVPVKISIMLPIAVAARELPRGKILTADDIRLEKRDIASIHRGYLEKTDYAIGKVLKRSLRRGQILTASHTASPQAIKTGSRVTIVANSGSIAIRMKGKALSSGARGDRIRVQNESSKRELEATVVSPGIVEVTM